MGEKCAIKFSHTVANSTVIVGFFDMSRHGANGFTSFPKEGMLRIFSPEKSDGFGRV
jgi:hypothetical protein